MSPCPSSIHTDTHTHTIWIDWFYFGIKYSLSCSKCVAVLFFYYQIVKQTS